MFSLRSSLISTFLLLFVCLLWAVPSAGQIFVKADATGANNGLSWTDAFTDLQDALAVAAAEDEIWVAAGTYFPSTTDDAWVSFTLKDSLSLYGGLAGTETSVAQRNIAANPTILSGEIGGPGVEDNSKSVVVVPTGVQSAGYTVDGFTVTGGYGGAFGGGIRNSAGDFTYANLIISGNSASTGGGMYCTGQPTLTNVLFVNNSATGKGGGLMTVLAGDPVLEDCQYINNTSGDEGGAVLSGGVGITLTRCDFSSNTAAQGGGGVHVENYDITDCTFDDNHTLSGDGGAVFGEIEGTIRRSTFTNNTASTYGGAVHIDISSSTVFVIDAVFENNQGGYGGGLSNRLAPVVVSNAVFFGNTATTDGGGIESVSGTEMTLTNVSFYDNIALRYGGAINNLNTNPTLTNTILWGNTAGTSGDEIYNLSGTPDISYSIVQGSGGSGAGWDPSLGIDGGHNLDSDPMFANLSAGDLRLLTGSPAIDSGSNGASNLQSTDLDGNARIIGGVVDMGAYEFDPTTGVGDTPQLAVGLAQNQPNPFNPTTVIHYSLPGSADHVDLVVYSVRGERVRSLVSGPRSGGPHAVTWDGRNDQGEAVASGVFYYQLRTRWGQMTRRMVLLK